MGDIGSEAMLSTAAITPDRSRLFEVMTGLGGYITADQARACGYSWALLCHHVESGRFVRVRRGLHRFRDYPSSMRQKFIAPWLTVGNNIGTDRAQTHWHMTSVFVVGVIRWTDGRV
jgi:hypothetical protein